MHEEGESIHAAEGSPAVSVTFTEVLASDDRELMYNKLFHAVLIFYLCWNLLANSLSQFQTFLLVELKATQAFATFFGIVLNAPGVFLVFKFSSIAGSPRRNKLFYIGIAAQALSMAGIAFGNSYLAVAVIMLTCYNIGNQIAGESLYKVWAQESFPEESRTSFQGCISGASRLLCGSRPLRSRPASFKAPCLDSQALPC